ncbi:ParB N-terminal domain-containing protein [Enterococcus dongliensis]|uniref:ParB N-terminal domain-containing protein n=1 Tax=Enterococcus dongliensis TaxID=2559925 RepID=UPI002890B70D|nr:ParB N-terminal domain-containing protein [Enterococcus dongliensis]MDT2641004.1 ParB N-terminal domain-containing protein [Enterococcus dongliensis]
MDREISDIYETNNYDMFTLLETNRKISKNQKLEHSILKKGILRPIAVNSKMQIIDGQHRYSIAKKHKLTLPYYVTMNKEMNDIIEINNTVHKWTLNDYINKYVTDGNIEYIKLKKLMETHRKISNADMVSAAMGSWYKQSKLLNNVKNGSFKFYNFDEFLVIVQGYEELLRNTQIKEMRSVFQAYFKISSIDKFNQSWFIKKINETEVNRKIIGLKKTERILKCFLEAYNSNLQAVSKRRNAIDWELDLKHRVIIKDKLKTERLNSLL